MTVPSHEIAIDRLLQQLTDESKLWSITDAYFNNKEDSNQFITGTLANIIDDTNQAFDILSSDLSLESPMVIKLIKLYLAIDKSKSKWQIVKTGATIVHLITIKSCQSDNTNNLFSIISQLALLDSCVLTILEELYDKQLPEEVILRICNLLNKILAKYTLKLTNDTSTATTATTNTNNANEVIIWYRNHCIHSLISSLGRVYTLVTNNQTTIKFTYYLRILSNLTDKMILNNSINELDTKYLIILTPLLLTCDVSVRKTIICRLVTPVLETYLSLYYKDSKNILAIGFIQSTIDMICQLLQPSLYIPTSEATTEPTITQPVGAVVVAEAAGTDERVAYATKTASSNDLSNPLLLLCLLLSTPTSTTTPTQGNNNTNDSSSVLALLCTNPHTSGCIWAIVQQGLLSTDSLLRKRALYIIQHMYNSVYYDDNSNTDSTTHVNKEAWADLIQVFVQVRHIHTLYALYYNYHIIYYIILYCIIYYVCDDT